MGQPWMKNIRYSQKMESDAVRVMIEANMRVDGDLILKIDQTGQTYKARVAWQDENEIGLRFSA